MIHHISISAKNPQYVTQVLAEILKGQTAPFPPHPGGYVVLPFDKYGTAIEVYPLGTQILPGEGDNDQVFVQTNISSKFTYTHVAISVPVSQEEIERIGIRENWRVLRCNRADAFDVMEFWVENRLMLELLTPEMVSAYLTFVQSENLKYFFAAPWLSTT